MKHMGRPLQRYQAKAAQQSIADKVRHVTRATQNRQHKCHWPGCDKQVPPAVWGCRPHWYALPKALRDKIWRTYRVGQEQTLTPSAAYVAVAREVQEWIEAQPKPKPSTQGRLL